MKPSNIIHSHEFNSLPVNHQDGLHLEILQRLLERLEQACQSHSQVLMFCLVIQFPADSEAQSGNQLFSRWLADFIRSLAVSGYDPAYVWCWEECQDAPGRFHYHLVVLLDGNETQSAYGHLETATRYWAKANGLQDANGLIHLCQPKSELSFGSGFKLVRNASDFRAKFNEAFSYASYIAKTATKSPMLGVRSFGSSEMKGSF